MQFYLRGVDDSQPKRLLAISSRERYHHHPALDLLPAHSNNTNLATGGRQYVIHFEVTSYSRKLQQFLKTN